VAAVVDFVALSFLPVQWWRDVGPQMRAGVAAAEILERLIDQHPGYESSSAALRERAAAALSRAPLAGIRPVPWDHPDYPAALAAIFDPPPVLWARGHFESLHHPAVAIVGSRAGSAYALAVAERLAADLASRGVVIVSGLARGVDSAAHRGALAASGRTVAVLGCGADVVYPAEHRALAAEVVSNGAIVSELEPGTAPRAHFFPRRNRIISGLVRAVVIVEAGEKSGSLITARSALEQGREVLAVPGNVLNDRNRGGHALLRDGAKIVESADDIFEEIAMPVPAAPARRLEPEVKPGAIGAEDPVLASLPAGEACDLDGISERSGLTTARLLSRLLDLELRGRVRRLGGGRFARVDTSC